MRKAHNVGIPDVPNRENDRRRRCTELFGKAEYDWTIVDSPVLDVLTPGQLALAVKPTAYFVARAR